MGVYVSGIRVIQALCGSGGVKQQWPGFFGEVMSQRNITRATVGALIITYTILGVPYCNYSITAPKPYSNYSSPYAAIPVFVLVLSGKVAPNKDKDATKPEAESTKKAEAGRKKVS